MLKNNILNDLINAEQTVSGQRLADKYGVSRNAVWKAMNALKAEGYVIEGTNNSGYTLLAKDVLSETQIISDAEEYRKSHCDNARFTGFSVICLDSVDSTSSEAKRRSFDAPCTVIAAKTQTAGRGRMGRSFYSPDKTGAYFTVVLHGLRELSSAVKVTSLAACAVCRAIENLSPLKPAIKWVNDVYIDEKKVCGILTEAVSDMESGLVSDLLIGVGINVSTESFPPDIPLAGSLGISLSRSALIGAITCEILKEMPYIAQNRHIDYYRRHSLAIGRAVKFTENGITLSGVADDVSDEGELIVRLADGSVKRLSSGEITLRITEY